MNPASGKVAAGHPATAEAASEILRAGGNAFDAAIAAHFAACVAEPVLCSLGGGGFLLVAPATGPARCYDFFAQTPRRKRPPAELDFHPIHADFGTARQEFHIGLGAVATPGSVAGLFAIHRDLGYMPMRELVAPAVALARDGIVLNDFQAFIFRIVAPIYLATPESRAIFADPDHPDHVLGTGQRLHQPDQADFLEVLAIEGEELFRRGEVAAAIDRLCREDGGHLRRDDMEHYAAARHAPLAINYRDARLLLTPPPSTGGLLVAFGLSLLAALDPADLADDAGWLPALARVLALTAEARAEAEVPGEARALGRLLEPDVLARYRDRLTGPVSRRGTTHVSIADAAGNLASMTVSNGEGCGHIVPGTGIMLNNMLGEADINPGGFHCWTPDTRLISMMTPALLRLADGTNVALGTGGSNRIRSAMLAVISRLVDQGLPLAEAITAPRLHVEGEHLDLEAGFDPAIAERMLAEFPDHTLWAEPNLFFGGVHAVSVRDGTFDGAGDPRRGGVAV